MAQDTSLRGAKVTQGGQNITFAPLPPYFPRLWVLLKLNATEDAAAFIVQ